MRVLVVDDTAVFRRAISEALSGIPDVEVIGTAANGKLALSRIAEWRPDLITLDIEMPEMNGLEVLKVLSQGGKGPGVILLSTHTSRGCAMTVRGLELGAFGFLPKPTAGAKESIVILREGLSPLLRAFELRSDVRTLLRGKAQPDPRSIPQPIPRLEEQAPARIAGVARNRRAGSPLVLIGVSTGGPAALARVLPGLPLDLGAPVFIVQHMPAFFTEALARNLDSKSALHVKQAEDGERPRAGVAYLAPGGRQMKLERDAKDQILIRITEDPPENNCRPAVDYLFRSAALNFPGRSVAVILTGMGSDGTVGLKMLKRTGCLSIAQDELSCVVFGMPKEAIQSGAVDLVVPLEQVAAAIVREVRV